MKKIIVIGAGASGMTAAICAARSGAAVTILEKTGIAGKKLSMTGNGRCNLSNTEMSPDCYNIPSRSFVAPYTGGESVETVIGFMRSVGVLVRSEEGYLYPVSGQASTVVNALLTELRRLNAEIVFGTQVKEIIPSGKGFMVRTSASSYGADAVIVSCGGLSGPKTTASDGDGYYMAEKLGLFVTPRRPALVRLKSDDPYLPSESGVRMWADISFLADGLPLANESGEIQITKGAISGIPVLQASPLVAKALEEGKKVSAVLDFFSGTERRRRARRTDRESGSQGAPADTISSGFTKAYTTQFDEMWSGRDSEPSMGDFLNGICNSHITDLILARYGLKRESPALLTGESIRMEILKEFRSLHISVSGTGAFTEAQATSGGIDVKELSTAMESLKCPGVFFTGEIMDVDGRCGGYNLHWAFISGMIAGEAAAKKR